MLTSTVVTHVKIWGWSSFRTKKRGKRIVSGRDALAHLPLDRLFLFLRDLHYHWHTFPETPGSQEAFSWVGLPLSSSIHTLEFPVISKLRTSQGLQVSKSVQKRLVPLLAAHFRGSSMWSSWGRKQPVLLWWKRGETRWTPHRLNYGRTGKPGGRGSLGHWLCGNSRVWTWVREDRAASTRLSLQCVCLIASLGSANTDCPRFSQEPDQRSHRASPPNK